MKQLLPTAVIPKRIFLTDMYIKPSTYTKKILICLNRAGHAESLGNDDISATNAPKYEKIRDGVKQKMPEGTPWFETVTVIFKTLLYYMCSVPFCGEALLTLIKKTEIFNSLSHFTLSNKHHKLSDHGREKLRIKLRCSLSAKVNDAKE